MAKATQYFLLKTEPSVYSFDDLARDGATCWDGITAPPALAHLRKARVGDRAFVYHTGDERRVIGVCEIASEPYADPKEDDPRRTVVDVRAKEKLAEPVTLDAMKTSKSFAGSPLLRQGRLSVVPLTASQWKWVMNAGAAKKRSASPRKAK